MRRDVYFGRVRLSGEEHEETLSAANNYASYLNQLHRFEEAKALFRKATPVTRRVLGESHERTLIIRTGYMRALYLDPDATLDDLREAVTTLEEVERIARRVLGGAQPTTKTAVISLERSREALSAAEACLSIVLPS